MRLRSAPPTVRDPTVKLPLRCRYAASPSYCAMTSADPTGATMTAPGSVRVFWIFATLVAGFFPISAVTATPWFRHGPVPAVASVALLAVAVIWGCSRARRIRLDMDDHGLTVRNYFWTYRFNWTEVRCFTNGSVYLGDQERPWPLRVVLRDGRAVTAVATADAAGSNAKMTAIRRAAKNHGIPADLGGVDLAPPVRAPRRRAAR